MGNDIMIMNGKNFNEKSENTIYHATYHGTSSFRKQSSAFNRLMSLVDEIDKGEFTLEKYSDFISQFKKEKDKLEKEENTSRGNNNSITLYDCVSGCYEGLKKAKSLGKKIIIC